MAKIANKTTETNEQVQNFSIGDFLKICLKHWVWFLCSLIFFMGIGVVYILRKQPVYERSTELLIKDNDSGGSIGDMGSVFSGLGLFSSNTSVYNELIALLSPSIMYQVVDRLDLTMNYGMKQNLLRWNVVYGNTNPVFVVFEDIDPNQSVSFKAEITPEFTLHIYEFSKYSDDGKRVKISKEVTLPIGGVVNTPLGKISSHANPNFNGKKITEVIKYNVGHQGRQSTVETYLAKIKGDLANQDADVISLSIDDVSTQRADDILNTIVEVYNEMWISDKNKMAIATSKFIDERIATIQYELNDVDDEISDYSSRHMITDVPETAKITLQAKAEGENEISLLRNNIAMTDYLRTYVKNPQNSNLMIPVNTGIASPSLESLIAQYDTDLNSKIALESNSSASNPIVVDLERQLKQQRDVIIKGLDNHVAALQKELSSALQKVGQAESALAQVPVQTKDLLGATRQQEVKNALYLFLLQKKEENELTQKFTADNTRIITPPYGSLKPVAPKKTLILGFLLFLALGIPGVFFYVQETSNDAIRSRKDVEGTPLPYIGEIPLIGKKKRTNWLKKLLKHSKEEKEETLIVVEEGKRDIANEAFRVVRSNIDLMIGKDKGCQTIMLTSANAGSGKSFITYNLALTFGLKKKRVLMIDCDLRHSSLSMFINSPKKGVSNYLADSTDDWKSLMVKVSDSEEVYMLPVGYRPPNPAELLEDGRLGKLLEEAKNDFDYILLDCPPVDIVVDTQIVEQFSDRTIFVVRAGLFRRSALVDITELYDSKKYKHMSLLLNATESGMTRYHAYGSSDYYTQK